MDQSTVERAIRPQKLTVKNALFAGSDGGARHWAIVATLIETAKMCRVKPYAYLRDILIRITAGHTINKIAELAPWNYAPKPTEQSGRSAADLQAASVAEKPSDQKVMAA